METCHCNFKLRHVQCVSTSSLRPKSCVVRMLLSKSSSASANENLVSFPKYSDANLNIKFHKLSSSSITTLAQIDPQCDRLHSSCSYFSEAKTCLPPFSFQERKASEYQAMPESRDHSEKFLQRRLADHKIQVEMKTLP